MTEERLVFGVTLNQLDELHTLLRTITAHGDVISLGGEAPLHPQTVPTLGEAVFNTARAVRKVFDRIEAQKLPAAADSESHR